MKIPVCIQFSTFNLGGFIMKLKSSIRLAMAAGLMFGILPEALAAGTVAGTTVSNTASVDYVVGGVNQTDVNSNAKTFVVDRKINMTVAESGGAATSVVPGATVKVTTFTVTNNSNSIADFKLAATQQTGGTAPFGGTDNFNVTNLLVYVDANANGTYDAGTDTATYIDELAIGDSKTVFVLGDIPIGSVDGDKAVVILTANAAMTTNGTTGAYVATSGSLAADAVETNTTVADDMTFIDTVFGDSKATGGNTAGDGVDFDKDQFNVVTASIAVTKSATVYSDPFNGTTNPKSIPGAVIEYCLDVQNTGTGTADTIVLTDVVPTNTTFVAGSIKSAATGTGSACDLGSGVTEDDDTTGDAGEADAPTTGDYNVTGANAITVRTGSIAGAARFKATFRVTVD